MSAPIVFHGMVHPLSVAVAVESLPQYPDLLVCPEAARAAAAGTTAGETSRGFVDVKFADGPQLPGNTAGGARAPEQNTVPRAGGTSWNGVPHQVGSFVIGKVVVGV